MALEIERKFLLKDDSWRHAVLEHQRMVQGYLGGKRCSVRVRISGAEAWLSVKSRVQGSVRHEFEYAIPMPDAETMLAELREGPAIEKMRHHVQVHGKHWEIDEFLGDNAPLILAEIELDHVDETFSAPLWLGQEVTMYRRYFNSELSRRPYVDWEELEKLPGSIL